MMVSGPNLNETSIVSGGYGGSGDGLIPTGMNDQNRTGCLSRDGERDGSREHQKFKVKSLSHVRLFETPWIVACQAPLFMGFSKLEYWSGLPFPSPGDLPDPGIEPRSPALQADSLPSEPPGKS